MQRVLSFKFGSCAAQAVHLVSQKYRWSNVSLVFLDAVHWMDKRMKLWSKRGIAANRQSSQVTVPVVRWKMMHSIRMCCTDGDFNLPPGICTMLLLMWLTMTTKTGNQEACLSRALKSQSNPCILRLHSIQYPPFSLLPTKLVSDVAMCWLHCSHHRGLRKLRDFCECSNLIFVNYICCRIRFVGMGRRMKWNWTKIKWKAENLTLSQTSILRLHTIHNSLSLMTEHSNTYIVFVALTSFNQSNV